MTKMPWIKLWRGVLLDEKISFLIARYGHEVCTLWIGILTSCEDGVLRMDEDVLAALCHIEEKRYQELRGVLLARKLLMVGDEGHLEVPNWDEYQQSESTERVRRYRERQRASDNSGPPSEPSIDVTLQKRDCNGDVTGELEGEGEGEEKNLPPSPKKAEAVVETGIVVMPEDPITRPQDVQTSKPKRQAEQDPLYRAVWDSCLAVAVNFSNYQREGEGCRRFCRLIRTRSPTDPVTEARRILELFARLRETGSAFWRGQPFTPSVLASAAIFDRLVAELDQAEKANDTSWVDELARKGA